MFLVTAAIMGGSVLLWAAADNPGLAVLCGAGAGLQVLYYALFAGFGVTLTPQGLTANGFSTPAKRFSSLSLMPVPARPA